MRAPPIIVVGASAGGVEALGTLAAALPENLPAALLVVLHIGPHRSDLPKVLNQLGSLPADHAKDGDPICPGRIYVAPPDHHMIIEPGFVRLTKAPRENWARPAIDPLFRSAAQVYGSNVVGVILTGGLNDGTAGLYEIKKRGGITVVQNPDDAVSDGMPRSALANVTIDHCLPLAMIPQLLERLSNERRPAPIDNFNYPTKAGRRRWKQNTPCIARVPSHAPIVVGHCNVTTSARSRSSDAISVMSIRPRSCWPRNSWLWRGS